MREQLQKAKDTLYAHSVRQVVETSQGIKNKYNVKKIILKDVSATNFSPHRVVQIQNSTICATICTNRVSRKNMFGL